MQAMLAVLWRAWAADHGVGFLTETAVARSIREDAFYPGVRVAMDSRIATAVVRFRLDVNSGDPVTPAPRTVELPSLRPDTAPVRALGCPIETVLAAKLATAIMLDTANTRVRDYADIYTLTDATTGRIARSALRCRRPPGSAASRSWHCRRSSTVLPSCANPRITRTGPRLVSTATSFPQTWARSSTR